MEGPNLGAINKCVFISGFTLAFFRKKGYYRQLKTPDQCNIFFKYHFARHLIYTTFPVFFILDLAIKDFTNDHFGLHVVWDDECYQWVRPLFSKCRAAHEVMNIVQGTISHGNLLTSKKQKNKPLSCKMIFLPSH